jgi:alpha-tubulin suppressor-like RCC1 family protein
VDTSGALADKTLTLVSAGYDHECALDAAGAAYCWGYDGFGELGNGKTGSSSVPVAVDTSGALAGKTLSQVSASWYHTCAVDTAGAAYCWGDNVGDALGVSSITRSSVPVAVDNSGALAGKTLTRITTGQEHTCALDSTGAAYCWGSDAYGQLGDGTTNGPGPVAVDASGALSGKTLTQISAGYGHTCALDSAGAIYCWGDNTNGDLGDGAENQSDVPVLVHLRELDGGAVRSADAGHGPVVDRIGHQGMAR